jgi:GT2 family glycosyltransferase
MKYAPIVLFVYKRPAETQKVLEALSVNEGAAQSELIVYADGPKSDAEKESCEAVRQIVRSCTGFAGVTLYAAEKNRGLANSVIAGVTETLEKFDRVIVLEDDLVTSKYFLSFMNEALERYADDDSVCCIHGFSYPTKHPEIQYFLRRGADCWGWATWKRGWQIFEHDSRKLYDEITCRKLQKLFDRN